MDQRNKDQEERDKQIRNKDKEEIERYEGLTYQTSGYTEPLTKYKVLNLDITVSGTKFTGTLREECIIDNLSDVYIETFMHTGTYHNLTVHDAAKKHDHFQFKIDQIPANAIHTNFTENGSFIIKNSRTSGSGYITEKLDKVTHIGYIFPTTLSTITGEISGMDKKTAGGGPEFFISFLIVERD